MYGMREKPQLDDCVQGESNYLPCDLSVGLRKEEFRELSNRSLETSEWMMKQQRNGREDSNSG